MSSFTNLVEELTSLTEFFGCHLSEVDSICLRMAMDIRPEWLRGKPNIEQLPRWCNHTPKHTAAIDHSTFKNKAEMIVWIVENCQHYWKVTGRSASFSNDEDAVHFALRWG